jgi:hypothetical protein
MTMAGCGKKNQRVSAAMGGGRGEAAAESRARKQRDPGDGSFLRPIVCVFFPSSRAPPWPPMYIYIYSLQKKNEEEHKEVMYVCMYVCMHACMHVYTALPR